MRGAGGRGEGFKTLRGLQELLHNSACGFLHAKDYAKRLCKSLFQSCDWHSARRAGVRRIQAATRIPPSPLVKLAGFENVEGCGYKLSLIHISEPTRPY